MCSRSTRKMTLKQYQFASKQILRKSTIETLQKRQWRRSGVFIVIFEHFTPFSNASIYWLWTGLMGKVFLASFFISLNSSSAWIQFLYWCAEILIASLGVVSKWMVVTEKIYTTSIHIYIIILALWSKFHVLFKFGSELWQVLYTRDFTIFLNRKTLLNFEQYLRNWT